LVSIGRICHTTRKQTKKKRISGEERGKDSKENGLMIQTLKRKIIGSK